MFRSLLLASALCLLALPAAAVPALVLEVHDGDTVTLLMQFQRVNCRIAGIDSPEFRMGGRWGDQPGADEARAALSNMIMGQTVDVEDTGQCSYKRMVSKITATIDGQAVNVNEAMVAEGWAWDAVQFEPAKDRDPEMEALQARAQAAHIGIWAGHPVPPWDWRHNAR